MALLIVPKLADKLVKEGDSFIKSCIPACAIFFTFNGLRGELPSGRDCAGNPSLSSGINGLFPTLVSDAGCFPVEVDGSEAAVWLLFSASILLTAIGLAPTVLAILIASESEIPLGCGSEVFIPKIPASISLFSRNLTSFTMLDKLSEKVNSVETAIFSKLSKAIPLLLDAL